MKYVINCIIILIITLFKIYKDRGKYILNRDICKRTELLQKIKEFRLFDDDFMSRVFDNNIECTELILRIILNNQDIKVKKVCTQSEIKNLFGRSVRLDIYATDKDNKPVDIEIQRSDKGAGVKRARYNSSMIDANTLVKGGNFDTLPESFIIFITENDVMGANLPIYHADRIISETGKPLGDGTHIVYINGAYRDESPIGKLMHDFSCKDPSDMYYKPLAEQVRYFKEDVKGVEDMCRIVEDIVEKEKREEKIEMIARMKRVGKLSFDEISEITGFTVEEIEAIKVADNDHD